MVLQFSRSKAKRSRVSPYSRRQSSDLAGGYLCISVVKLLIWMNSYRIKGREKARYKLRPFAILLFKTETNMWKWLNKVTSCRNLIWHDNVKSTAPLGQCLLTLAFCASVENKTMQWNMFLFWTFWRRVCPKTLSVSFVHWMNQVTVWVFTMQQTKQQIRLCRQTPPLLPLSSGSEFSFFICINQ